MMEFEQRRTRRTRVGQMMMTMKRLKNRIRKKKFQSPRV
jgi:hypothetical protein